MKLKLTNAELARLLTKGTDNRGGDRYADALVSGLYVTVYPSGTAQFLVRYRANGVRRSVKLGNYAGTNPDPNQRGAGLTIDEARSRARVILGEATTGTDAKAERRKVREATKAAKTVGEWIDHYLAEVAALKRQPRHDHQQLGKAKKLWADIPLAELSRGHVRRAVSQIAAKHPVSANRFLAYLRACLNEAVRAGALEHNPAAGERINRRVEKSRDRVLTDTELAAFIAAADKIANPYGRAALLVLATTGLRLGEVLQARWSDLDFAHRVWRLPETKAGKPQAIPLTEYVAALLKSLPRVQGNPYVFVGHRRGTHLYDVREFWAEACKLAELKAGKRVAGGIIPHDLRRTVGLKVAREAGLQAASLLLRHSNLSVTQKHYAPFVTEDSRPAAEIASNVISLPARRVEQRAQKARKRA